MKLTEVEKEIMDEYGPAIGNVVSDALKELTVNDTDPRKAAWLVQAVLTQMIAELFAVVPPHELVENIAGYVLYFKETVVEEISATFPPCKDPACPTCAAVKTGAEPQVH